MAESGVGLVSGQEEAVGPGAEVGTALCQASWVAPVGIRLPEIRRGARHERRGGGPGLKATLCRPLPPFAPSGPASPPSQPLLHLHGLAWLLPRTPVLLANPDLSLLWSCPHPCMGSQRIFLHPALTPPLSCSHTYHGPPMPPGKSQALSLVFLCSSAKPQTPPPTVPPLELWVPHAWCLLWLLTVCVHVGSHLRSESWSEPSGVTRHRRRTRRPPFSKA